MTIEKATQKENEKENRVYIFGDGPNIYESSKKNLFRIDFQKLFVYLGNVYGRNERVFWYDLEPDISPVDFERVQTPKLKNLSLRATQEKKTLESLLLDERAHEQEQETLFKEAINFYSSIQRTKSDYEGRVRFLNFIQNIAEIIMDKGRTYEHTIQCPSCRESLSLVGKTEGGRTDFNLATDMVYYAAKNSYDIAILLSGDGHFLKPTTYVQNFNKKVIVAAFRNSLNQELKSVADEVIELDSIRINIERDNGKRF